MGKGFTMLYRDYLDDPLYFSERFTRSQAFIDLCFNASYSERTFRVRGNKVELKRGQLAISLRDLSVRWKWSVNTVVKFLNDLKEDGYIDTQKTSVNQIITIKKYLTYNTQTDTQNNTQTDTQTDTPIIKEYKEKKYIKEEKDTKVSKKKNELSFSIVAPEFLDIVNLWLQYKKERGETYKPTGFEQMYKKLIKLSNNNANEARKIIEQSMANNWAGLFQLKKDSLPLGFIQKDEGNEKYEKAETW